VTGRVESLEGGRVKINAKGLPVQGRLAPGKKVGKGDEVIAIMRPEDFDTEPDGDSNQFTGTVEVAMFMGSFTQVKLRLDNGIVIKPYVDPDLQVSPGDRLTLYIPAEKTIVYPMDEWEEELF